MIIDSHCHAWPRWPYQPQVPDSDSRGKVEQLLNEMDLHGVDQAVVICARIDHNLDNNEYVAEQVQRFPPTPPPVPQCRLLLDGDVSSARRSRSVARGC